MAAPPLARGIVVKKIGDMAPGDAFLDGVWDEVCVVVEHRSHASGKATTVYADSKGKKLSTYSDLEVRAKVSVPS